MDRVDYDTSGNPLTLMHLNDFVLPDFFDHGPDDFDPFAMLVTGDHTVDVPKYAHGGMVDDGQFGPGLEDVFGFNDPGFGGSNFGLDEFPSFVEDVKDGEEEDIDDDDDDDDDYSSATNTTVNTTSAATTPSPRTPTKKMKVDRSRTLVSERRRRGRMKEKLYALRALVPNITKMDKASIVGDAVLYVQELQIQAKKLKAEIAGLEATLAVPQKYHQGQPGNSSKKIHQAPRSTSPVPRKVLQVDVFQVEEQGFYVRLVSNRGVGVAASLYKALESLTGFSVQSSNLTSSSSSDRFTLTFTLNIRSGEPHMDLPSLRLWITGSLLNQGFELIQTA